MRVARQKRCRARFPALRPHPAGSSHGAGPRADVPRGPRKRGALGEGPARPPLMPALSVVAVRRCKQSASMIGIRLTAIGLNGDIGWREYSLFDRRPLLEWHCIGSARPMAWHATVCLDVRYTECWYSSKSNVENGTRSSYSYNGRLIGSRIWSTEWCLFQWPWVTLTQISRTRHYWRWISQKQYMIDTWLLQATNRKWYVAYWIVPLPMTLIDLEGLW